MRQASALLARLQKELAAQGKTLVGISHATAAQKEAAKKAAAATHIPVVSRCRSCVCACACVRASVRVWARP